MMQKKRVKLHPKICGMNLNKDGSVKNLQEDEPGIVELLATCIWMTITIIPMEHSLECHIQQKNSLKKI